MSSPANVRNETVTGPRPHRWSVDDYHAMVAAGVLAEDLSVELIDGEILDRMPIGNRHMAVLDRLNARFVRAVDPDAVVRVGGSVRLDRWSEPQPDLVLLRPRGDYDHAPAGPADILLAVEVAASSLAWDTGRKAALYARHGLCEYWVFDIDGARILRFARPDGGRWLESGEVAIAPSVPVPGLPGRAVDLSGVLRTREPPAAS